MKILYHHRTQAEDGQAVHIRSLIEAFRAEGHDVREEALVQRAQGAPAGAAEKKEEGPSLAGRVAGALPGFLRELAEYGYTWPATGRLVRAGREYRPDFLYERYAFGNLAGVRAARQLDIPIVLEVNSPMVHELSRTRGLAFQGLGRRVETAIFTGATRVCVVTAVLGEMLVEMGVPRENLLVTPNGVHLELYDSPDRAAAREALGLGEEREGELVLGFVGYYRDWHRLDLVVEGLAAPELSHASLVLIGAGPAEESLREAARRAGVTERLHFAGSRPHGAIPSLLPAFDVALVPAINPYASPLKLHEYMAAHLPVIAPDQPNLREVLTAEENALLVPPGDGDALLDAATRLAADPGLRSRLGAAGRRTIEEEDLTWRGNARRVTRLAETLIQDE